MSRDSGAGAYSHDLRVSTPPRSACSSWSVTARSSIDGEVVSALVGAGSLLADLHQRVVQQRGRPDPEQVGCHPLVPESLVQQDQVVDGLFRLTDAPGHLPPAPPAGLVEEVAR